MRNLLIPVIMIVMCNMTGYRAVAAENASPPVYEWPMIAGDGGWSGCSADPRVKPPFRLKWVVQTDSIQKYGLIAVSGKVFSNGYCLDAETGEVLWRYSGNTPASDGKRLYRYIHRGSRFSALDIATREEVWTRSDCCPVNRLARSGPACGNEIVYFAAKKEGDIRIEALEGATGKALWSTRVGQVPEKRPKLKTREYIFGGGVCTQPSVGGGLVLASTLYPKTVYALDRKTGKEVWRVEGICAKYAVGCDGTHAWAAEDKQGIWKLDLKTGKKIWHWGGTAQYSSVKYHYNFWDTAGYPPTVYFGLVLVNSYGNFTALDTETGKRLWECGKEKRFQNKGCSMPTAAGGYIYSTALYGADNAVYAIDPETHTPVWKHRTGGRFCSRPAIAYGCLYAPCHDGRVYCFEPVDEKYRTPEPQPAPETPAAPPTSLAKSFSSAQDNASAPDRPAGGKDWPMYGGCPARCGLDIDVRLPISTAWTYQTGDKIRSDPVIAEDTVFAGNDRGVFFALDLKTGTKKWSTDTGSRIRCAPAISEGIVVCGTDNGKVRAFAAKDGSPVWEFRTAGKVRASPVIVGNRVVFGSHGHRCYCLRLKDGKEFWRRRMGTYRSTLDTGKEFWLHRSGSEIHTPPAVANHTVFLGAWEDHKVVALDLGTGNPLKGFTPFRHGRPEGVSVYGNVLGVCFSKAATCLVEAGTGKKLASSKYLTGFRAGAPAFSRGKMYDGTYAAGIDTGERGVFSIKGRPRFSYPLFSVPLAARDLIIAATSHGTVEARTVPSEEETPSGKKVWEWKSESGAPIYTAPAAAGGIIVVGSDDGHVYAFSYGGT